MKVFTKEDITIANTLPAQYKYMARNKDGTLYIHKEMPTKNNSFWDSYSYLTSTDLDYGFESICFDDEEPILIEDIISLYL